jgi:EmrB/QacA subfamily drug resistance transporter
MTSPDAPNRRAVLIVTTVSSFLTPFMGSSVLVALPAIGGEFGMSAASLPWIAQAYLLATAAVILPLGRLADIGGRNRLFRAGLVLFTLVSILMAAAPSAAVLIACRAIQGAGSAMIFCAGLPILLAVYPPEERGKVLGINVAAVYLGLSLGPVLGGLLVQHAGWRSLFGFTAALGAGTLWLAFAKLRGEWAPARGEPYDAAGAALYGAGILALGLSFALLPRGTIEGAAGAGGWGLLAAGAAALAAFARRSLRAAHPLVDLKLFRGNPVFVFSNLAALIHYAATAAVGLLLSLYLQHVRGLPPQEAGLVLLAQPALMTLFSPLAGRLSDRLQPRVVASVGMAAAAVMLGAFAFVTAETPAWAIAAGLAALGVGYAFFSAPNSNAVLGAAPPDAHGVASAILSTMRLAGHVLSLGAATLILGLHLGDAPLRPENRPQLLDALHTAFPLLAAICVLGVIASCVRGNVKRES